MADRRAGRLVVIGLDGVSWRHCRPPAEGGTMSHVARLGKAGVLAPLTGADFSDGPAAWTSLATGLPPEDHGVFAGDEASGAGPRATSRRSWRARPWWEAAREHGHAIASVAWPANAPAAPLPGRQIDDGIARASGLDGDHWPLPLDCAAGPVRAALRDRRIHPTDIDAGLVARFVTDLTAVDQQCDPWLPHIAVALARAATIQAASVWALGESEASLVVLHQPWLTDMQAAFDPPPDDNFAPAMPTALAFLDDMIARLIPAAGPDATVLLLSPNRGRDPGVILASGPGAGRVDGGVVRLNDVVPTILGHLGLVDRALPGTALPLLAQRGDARPVTLRPPEPEPEPTTVRPLDPRLAAAGYRLPPPCTPAWQAQRTAMLALAILPRAPARTLALARAALALDPDSLAALRGVALAAVALGDPAALAGIAEAFDRIAPGRMWGALARGAAHVLRGDRSAAIAILPRGPVEADGETLVHLATLWLLAGQPVEAMRLHTAILADDPLDLRAGLGLAACETATAAFAKAERRLVALRQRFPFEPRIYDQLQTLYRATGRSIEGEQMARIGRTIG